ncbi:MAG: hypothetical protein LBE04_08585 [Prevotellaceae bacterium]|nr:hypothetical protein [Prevotellaceae bacterium]
MKDYKKDLNEKNIQPLSDDYIKFIRFAQYQIEKSGVGILAYVCNNGFLDGIIHRQMRKTLLEVFDKIYVLNLHGNSRKKETCPDGSKDENVFDIMQGVSINIFVKTTRSKKPANVFYRDLYGKREAKYDFLSDEMVSINDFSEIAPVAPYYFFAPKDFSHQKKYDEGISIRELFVVGGTGVETKNDMLAICFSRFELMERLTNFRTMSEDELIFQYPKMQKENTEWKRINFLKDAKEGKGEITQIMYRPFDIRFTYYTGKVRGFMCRPRHNVMRHMLRENICLIAKRGLHIKVAPVFISKSISDIRAWSSPGMQGTDYVYPLYTYSDTDNSRQPNFSLPAIEKFANKLKLKFVPEKTDERDTFAPIDVFDYIYAVLHSPSYCNKYQEFLKIDFPKVPYPTDRNAFWQLVELGGRLRQIHLLESDELHTIHINYPISGNNEVTKIKYIEEKVYINDAQYFYNVPKKAWNFYIGGYQPAQKWLKDRCNRILNYDDSKHYEKIINALYCTNKIVQEIDEII